MDWEQRIDEWRKRQYEQEKQEKEQGEKKREDREEREYERKLAKHQKKYKCHVCGKPSEGPDGRRSGGWGREGGFIGPEEFTTFWDQPITLRECSICKKWTCPADLHQDICKKCASKLR